MDTCKKEGEKCSKNEGEAIEIKTKKRTFKASVAKQRMSRVSETNKGSDLRSKCVGKQ